MKLKSGSDEGWSERPIEGCKLKESRSQDAVERDQQGLACTLSLLLPSQRMMCRGCCFGLVDSREGAMLRLLTGHSFQLEIVSCESEKSSHSATAQSRLGFVQSPQARCLPEPPLFEAFHASNWLEWRSCQWPMVDSSVDGAFDRSSLPIHAAWSNSFPWPIPCVTNGKAKTSVTSQFYRSNVGILMRFLT